MTFSTLLRRILRCDPPFPSMIGHTAQDLLKKLLVKDPHKRLGSGPRGAEDIKAHAFFKVLPHMPLTQMPLFFRLTFLLIHNYSNLLFVCLTGTKLGWSSPEEGAESIQARAEEWTWRGELCWGVHRDGTSLLSCQHAPKHRPPVPGQSLLYPPGH